MVACAWCLCVVACVMLELRPQGDAVASPGASSSAGGAALRGELTRPCSRLSMVGERVQGARDCDVERQGCCVARRPQPSERSVLDRTLCDVRTGAMGC